MAKTQGIQSSLAKARGYGSAKEGVHSWIALRVSGIANAIVSVWFLWFLSQVIFAPHEAFIARLGEPVNAIFMILFVISGFYHAMLGCREIIEDYFHVKWMKVTKLIGTYLFFFALGIVCIFSVLKISFSVGL